VSARSYLAVALSSAVASAVFVAVRTPTPLSVFLVIAAGVALVEGALLPSLATLRAPSEALRALFVGFGLSVWPLSLLAKVLKATTHHRPLGAVTFAFLALFVSLGIVAVALRVVARRSSSAGASIAARALTLVAALGFALQLVRLVRDPATRGGLVDVSVAFGSAALLCLVPWPATAHSSAQRVGPWAWTLLVVVGVALALGPAGAAASVASPALAAPLSWF
jgi:hypothetical protein